MVHQEYRSGWAGQASPQAGRVAGSNYEQDEDRSNYCQTFGEIATEGDVAVVDGFQMTVQVHASAAEFTEVDAVPPSVPESRGFGAKRRERAPPRV
ncbi:hypothetical protein [Paenarthrobacter sp. NPDC091669]|uniref:hypothetical protein n=1 Tax=Paenarthrobacter sp. NPDC091669 TaxID=3364384 RepID=UPI0037FA3717